MCLRVDNMNLAARLLNTLLSHLDEIVSIPEYLEVAVSGGEHEVTELRL